MNTPWGQSDGETVLAPGIVFYHTPGHGGIHLDPSHVRRLPAWAKTDRPRYHAACWFEEDCDWAIPTLVFLPELRAYNAAHPTSWEALHFADTLANAEHTAAHWHPVFYAAYVASKTQSSLFGGETT